MAVTDSISIKMAAQALADSLRQDSLRREPTNWGLVLRSDTSAPTDSVAAVSTVSPKTEEHTAARSIWSDGQSWVMMILLLLFCITAVKFRTNSKYITSLIHDLTNTRERHNMFDDTVRETSFMVMLNILWCLSAGVILNTLCMQVQPQGVSLFTGSMVCIGVATLYNLVMLMVYHTVGTVFSDKAHTAMWVKGFVASQGLGGVFLFPVAVLCLMSPLDPAKLLIIAAIVFGISKIIFLCKGFRIFFTQISSWVLFLYYLCSLEIVPMVFSYCAALFLRVRF